MNYGWWNADIYETSIQIAGPAKALRQAMMR